MGAALSASVHVCACVAAGRGGSCELMIGCIARAAATDIRMDTEARFPAPCRSPQPACAAPLNSAASVELLPCAPLTYAVLPPPVQEMEEVRWVSKAGEWGGASMSARLVEGVLLVGG